MAKTAAKSSTSTKKASASPSKAKTSPAERLEKVSEEAVQKLKALGIEESLQRDIEWCLGSYKADRNPVGLYEMAEKALSVFKAEKEKKTKGVTSKLIDDLEKVVNEAHE